MLPNSASDCWMICRTTACVALPSENGGASNEDIAAELQCVTRTIERKLRLDPQHLAEGRFLGTRFAVVGNQIAVIGWLDFDFRVG